MQEFNKLYDWPKGLEPDKDDIKINQEFGQKPQPIQKTTQLTDRFGGTVLPDNQTKKDRFGGTILKGVPLEEETASIKQDYPVKRAISNYTRPILQGLGSAGGTILGGTAGLSGGPAAPVTVTAGAVAGGTLGYAIGDDLADLFDQFMGLREPQPWYMEMQEAGESLRTGLEGEFFGYGLGPGIKAAGKGAAKIPGIGSLGNWVKDTAGKAYNILRGMPLSTKGAERKAGQVMVAMTHKGPIIMDNIEQARALEETIPGLKFELGQLTGDAGIVRYAQSAKVSTGDFATLQAEQAAVNTKAINDYIKKIKGSGTVEDTVQALTTKKAGIDTAIETAETALEAQTGVLKSPTKPIEINDVLKTQREAGEKAARDEASKLFDEVPNQVQMADDLFSELEKIMKPKYVDEAPGNFPASLKRVINKMTEESKITTEVPIKGATGKKPKVETITEEVEVTRTLTDLQGLRSDFLEDIRDLESKDGSRKAIARLTQAVKALDKKLGFDFEEEAIELAPLKRRAAIKHPETGKIIIGGPTHQNVMTPQGLSYDDFPGEKYDTDMGFMTKSGIFLDRNQATASLGAGESSALITGANPELRKAQKFFKENVIDKYPIISDTSLATEYFKSGPKGQQAAANFNAALGGDAAAKTALREHINQDLFDTVVSPKTGEITEAALNRWKTKYKYALEELGITKEFDSLAKARQAVDKALVNQKEFNKSAASRILGADVDDVVKKAFAKGSKSTAAKDLMKQIEGDPKALVGLQNAFIDEVLTEIPLEGDEIVKLLTSKKTVAKLRKYDAAMRVIFKDAPEKRRAIQQVRSAVKVLERGTKAPKVSGVDRLESLFTVLSKRHGYSRRAIVNVALATIKPFKDISNSKVNEIINRALLDPDFAYSLIYAVKHKGTEKALRPLRNNLATAGYLTAAQEEKE